MLDFEHTLHTIGGLAFGFYNMDLFVSGGLGRAFENMFAGGLGAFATKMTLFWFCFVLVGLIMPNILIGVLSNAYVHSERSYLSKRGAARVRPFIQVAIEFFYNSVRNAPFFVFWKMRDWRLAALRPRFDAEYAQRGKITSNTRRLFLQSYEVTRLLATFVDPLGGVLLPVEDMQRLLVSVDDDDSLPTSAVIENFVRSFGHAGVADDVQQLQTLRFTDARLLARFVAQCIRPAERVVAAARELSPTRRRLSSGLGVQQFDPSVDVVDFADMLIMLARDDHAPRTAAAHEGTTASAAASNQAAMLRGACGSSRCVLRAAGLRAARWGRAGGALD
jgi:hypothetical protein